MFADYSGGSGRHGRRPSRKYRRQFRKPFRIREFVAAYLAAIFSWSVLTILVADKWPFLSLLIYVLAGFLITQFVSRRFERGGALRWNWHLASIADIARAKISMLLTWPVALPVLIWQLMIFKFL